jgi:hypothetical protein
MNLQGSYTYKADQETVWNLLMDPDAIAKAIPGVPEMEPLPDETDAWHANARIQVASIGGTYGGTIRITEKEPPNQYRLTVGGEGQQSIINGSAFIRLEYNEDTQETEVIWDGEANVAGKLAGVGQRLIAATANMLSKRFFKALADQLPHNGADAAG